jgi:hypothetical protein
MFVAFFFLWLALLVAGLTAWIPRFGPAMLGKIGWRRIPRLGRLGGLAASGVLLGAACVSLFAAAVTAPPSPQTAQSPTAASVSAVAHPSGSSTSAAATSTTDPTSTVAPTANSTSTAGSVATSTTAPVSGDAPPVGGSPAGPTPSSCHMSVDGLSDPACTPGATNPAVTQATIASTICVSGYTETIRPPTSYTNPLKVQQMGLYGDAGTTADYEEDHLIPLEVGGDPRDPRNLWPEPYALRYGAHQKDQVENWARDEVCSGREQLAAVQLKIATNWIALYQAIAGVPTSTPTAVTAPPTTSAPTPATTTAPPQPGVLTVTITASSWGNLSASTSPGATCTAQARYANGNVSTAQGITATHVADANGSVSWTYTRTSTTTKGIGTHTVTCSFQGQTASASAPFTVN